MDLFEGPLQSSLRDDELIVSATFPTLGPNAVSSFAKSRETWRLCRSWRSECRRIRRQQSGLLCTSSRFFRWSRTNPTGLDDLLVGHRIEDVGYTEIYNSLSSQPGTPMAIFKHPPIIDVA